MQKIFKNAIFALLMVLMALPLLMEIKHPFRESEMRADLIKPERPEVSIKAIATQEFQKKTEEYENNNFGFRKFLAKLKRSVNYLLFKDISNSDQVAGRDGYIYGLSSVERNIGGRYYNGKEKNDSMTAKINFIKETIEKKGGHFLAVIAPAKESVIPEKLPSGYDGDDKVHSDYDDLVEGYKKYNIPCIDFCSYFKKIRPSCPYPLFTKTGYHWSMYGASLVQDSLLSYVQDLVAVPIPQYHRTGVEWTKKAPGSDADFETQLNLFYSLQSPLYVFPKLEMIQSSLNNYRPKVMVIGDSFFWTIKDLEKLQYIFSEDSKYLFYFKRSLPLTSDEGTELKNIDVMSELESADLVILFSSLSSLGEFPYGFPDYYAANVAGRNIFECIRGNLKDTPSRFAALINDARNDKIESLIIAEAKSIYRNRIKFQLKASNNKYVCADSTHDSLIFANSKYGGERATFSLVNFKDRKSSLFSYTNKFLSVETGHETEITAKRTAIGEWETFIMIDLRASTIALKASNNKYLTVDEKSLQLFARGDSIGRNEKFKVIYVEKN